MSRTRNIADEIARDLRQQIINGQYLAGDRLPAERELAQTWAFTAARFARP